MRKHLASSILLVLLSVSFLKAFQVPFKLNCKEDKIYECTLIENLDSFDIAKTIQYINSGIIQDSILLACGYHQIALEYYYSFDDYLNSNKYNKLAEKIRKIIDDGLLWKSYLNLGLNFYALCDYKQAINYLEKALDEKGRKTSVDSLMILKNLGESYAEIGDYESAIRFSKKSIDLDLDVYDENWAINTLALILIKTKDTINIKSAINYSKLVNNSSRSEINLDNKEFALENLANANNLLGNYSLALEYYNEILSIIDNDRILYKATVFNNISSVYFHQQRYQEAINMLNESLTLYREYHNTSYNFDYGAIYENMGDNYLGLSKYEIALNNYQKAAINLTNHFRNTDVFENPTLSNEMFVYSNPDLIQVFHLKAKAAFEYYKQNNDHKFLSLAENTYSRLFDFHDQLQMEISTENSRLFQAEKIIPYLENALEVIYRQQKNGNNVNEVAFRFMEKNKATVLLQSINESDAFSFANLPDSLVQKERELKTNITEFKRQLSEARLQEDDIKIEQIQNILFDEKKVSRQLNNKLENNFPDYYNLKYQSNNIRLKNVQYNLDENTAILEYFIGDSSIYILSIQKYQVDFHKIEKPLEWQQKVDDFTENIIYKHHDLKYTEQAYELFQLIVDKPIACLNDNIKHLQIIPDAELNKIPFAALLTNQYQIPKDSIVKFADLSYLSDSFFISYGYSSKLLLEANKEKEQIDFIDKYAAFLAADSASINQYCDQHVSNISTGLNSKFYMKENCSKDNFKAFANKYSILNLTMHGCGKKGALTFNDGDLTDGEIYNLNLSNNQLIYLTACETNVGTLQKGEGVMSLSRAFTYAGCPSLVSTLWSVHPESTCVITELFFDEIKKGKPIDKALSEAQKGYIDNYIKSPDKIDKNISAHPYYWAGIIPIGKMDAIEFR